MKNICVWVALLCIGTAASAQDGGTPEPAQPEEPAPSESEALALPQEDVPKCSVGNGKRSPACDVLEVACNKPENWSQPVCATLVGRLVLDNKRALAVAPSKPEALPPPSESLTEALQECLGKDDCNNMQDLSKDVKGFLSLQLWCRKNAANVYSSYPASVAAVCSAAWSNDPNRFKQVSRVDLALFLEQVKEPAFECGGFGLTLPLFSMRRSGGDYEVNGPVAAGIGGGYYHAFRCRETWTWGPEVFAFSEGLDPAKTFQVGVAAGLSVTAFKYFNFGLAVGYDVFRRQTLDDGSKRSTGLLTGKDLNKENLTWLITFGVKNVSEKESDDEGSKTATSANSGSGSN